jgi:inner membrane transporter RhtA
MDQQQSAPRIPPEPLFVLGGISQYIGAAIAVELFEFLPARNVALLRVIGASLLVIAFRRSWRRQWTRSAFWAAAAFGSVLAAMNLAFYLAIDDLPLGNAVAIEFLGPISVAAFGARSARSVASLVLAGAGVALIAGIQPEGSLVGIGFALLAALLWAGYIVLGHRVARSGFGVDGLGVGMAVGALVIAPVAGPGLNIERPGLLLLALLTGLFSNAIPYGIDQVVMSHLTRARFALLQSLLPVTAALMGLVALGQRLQALEWAGIAAVAVAIWLGSSETEPDVVSSGVGA